MDPNDWKKRIREDIRFSESVRGEQYLFRSTWGLFSPRNIDEGSQ